MGVFLGAMSDTSPPILAIAGKEVPQAPLREQVKVAFRATGTFFLLFLFVRFGCLQHVHTRMSPADGYGYCHLLVSHCPPSSKRQSMLLAHSVWCVCYYLFLFRVRFYASHKTTRTQPTSPCTGVVTLPLLQACLVDQSVSWKNIAASTMYGIPWPVVA
jgi:hypothetical protein